MLFVIPLFKENERIVKQYTRLLNGKIPVEYTLETLNVLKKDKNIDYEIWTNINEIKMKFDYMNMKFIPSLSEAQNLKNNDIVFINPDYPLISVQTIKEYIQNDLREIVWDNCYILFENLSFIKNDQQSNVEMAVCESIEKINLGTRVGWWIAEKDLRKKRIILYPLSGKSIGTGHIYRGLIIASRLFIDHDIAFLFREDQKLAISMVVSEGFEVLTYQKTENPTDIIIDHQPDIIINDLLNTSKAYITTLKKSNIRVINFEDMGEGANYADAVINALYPGNVPHSHFYTGEDYYCLRDEFIGLPKKVVTEDVKEVLITYGGEDPQFLTLTTLKGIQELQSEYGFHIKIILGPAFNNHNRLYQHISDNALSENVTVYENVKEMAKFMRQADIIFTSAGRTMYEIATIGTPAVITAQNYRELTHTYGHPYNGFYNLGYFAEVSEVDFYNVTKKLILNTNLRLLMNKRMVKRDFSTGINRVLRIILNESSDGYE